MASAEVDSPSRDHLDERSPVEDRPPSPPRRDRERDRDRERPRRDGGDSYRPGRERPQERPRPNRLERLPSRPERKEREAPPPVSEEQKLAAAKAEYEKLLNARSGGTYIPPARLRALQAQITDKTSKEYQRMAWEALKKSINGLINKVNVSNIKHIVPELFGENLIRGRGLFCRSIMKAQAASLPFTPIYAAMAAVVNTKLPQVGELLVKRLVVQFRKGFKRNDKAVCLSSTTFLAHLINAQVVHELLAGHLLLLLLKKPTDDSVEIAVGLMKEVGAHLQEMQPVIAVAVFDQFRNILHEADIDKRTQYMIEVLFQVRKDGFKDNPPIKEELDLVEEEDQITHQISLDGEIDVQDGLNIFKFDPDYEENEKAYERLKAEILGEGSDDEDDDDDESDDEEEDEQEKAMEIKDQSNTDLVNLRRTIYLTLMSSIDPEEATHKLMKINLPAGQESELPSMIIECCSQEKTYSKFYGLIGERFAKINRLWMDLFEQMFAKYYETIHRYETNRLRNIARFFGHLFGSDAIPWHVMSVIHLNEEETTSASRIFIKILFQDISEEIGMVKLQARMKEDMLRPSLEGLFPRDNPRNIRFSINYFTSIGMGALTEESREYLQNMPKPALPAPPPAEESDSDSASSYSSYTGSYSSRSRSRSRTPRRAAARGRTASRTPPRAKRARSYSTSRSRSRTQSRSASPPRRGRSTRSPTANSLPSRRAAPPTRRRNSSSSRSSVRRRPGRYRDSRSPTRSVSHSRSRSRSMSRPRSASYDSRSRSPESQRGSSYRRRGGTPRAAPAGRRENGDRSRSRDRMRSRERDSYSRSRSPPRRRDAQPGRRGDRRADTASGSERGMGRNSSYSRSRSPAPRRADTRAGGRREPSQDRERDRRLVSPAGGAGGKRRRSYSESRSRSPPSPPVKRGRRGS